MNISTFCVTVLVVLATVYTVQGNSGLHEMLKSIDQTCNHIHGILTHQRRILNITVTKEAPLRVKVDMELISQDLSAPKQYLSAEGMVCHNGFDRNAANAACRSQKKKLQMFSQNYEWEPTPNDLHDKCYFSYNGDPFIVGCNFIFDNFNCPSSATSLLDCTHSPLFVQHCNKSMHVGISCSGTDDQPTTTTVRTTVAQRTTTRSADEEVVGDVLNRHNWTDIGAAIDVTGSMSSCYAQIDSWIALGQSKKLIKYFAFFNDGDNMPDANKVIGSTGGIYGIYASEGIERVQATATKAKNFGSGGDTPENDIEAILYTISNCKTCENIIHVADNDATPRDLILLSRVTKPIKVIVCKLSVGTDVNPKLLDIAYQTGGSLHTLNSDVETLNGLKVGDTIRIGSGVYQLGPTGFKRITRFG